MPLCKSADMAVLRQAVGNNGLMGRSITALQSFIAPHLGHDVDIPGHGEAGSYAHNQHQLNYRLCETAGLLFQVSGEQRYRDLALSLLNRYADCYLGLGFQKARNTNPPGRIFHQILNENMWLLSMSIGYGYIKAELGAEQKLHIEKQLFRPCVTMMTVLYAHDFATIHNHGLWGCAAVGTCGLVIGDERYVALAVDGLQGDRRTGGFLAELSLLFAPSGYYIEGPYYHRFAMRPLLIFAEALQVHRPDLDIYNYNDQVIRKTIRALLSTIYPNGCFPALNDSSLSMGIDDEGVLLCAAVYNGRYGKDEAITALAKQQGQVWVQPIAMSLADAADNSKSNALPFWPSVELNEGPQGDKGAQGFLRANSSDGDISQVCMGYGQHGMDHGHFDVLGLTFFNRGHEALREYGFARWLNVETKFGGRYLPENSSWARQTLAHNCVVVDRQSQCDGNRTVADQLHGIPHFFVGSGDVQGMSARASEHYPGVGMQRSVFLVSHPALATPVLVDLYRLNSEVTHDYDYALHYSGLVCDTTLPVQYNNTQWNTLGDDHGYEHLMGVARAEITAPSRVTWLQGDRFNTWLTAATEGELVFAQLGGNDASFNLRREPSFLLRQRGRNHLFASAFETHGYFHEASERCYGARGELKEIRVVGHNDQGSVIELIGGTFQLTLMVSNQPDVGTDTQNEVSFGESTYSWTGYFQCTTKA